MERIASCGFLLILPWSWWCAFDRRLDSTHSSSPKDNIVVPLHWSDPPQNVHFPFLRSFSGCLLSPPWLDCLQIVAILKKTDTRVLFCGLCVFSLLFEERMRLMRCVRRVTVPVDWGFTADIGVPSSHRLLWCFWGRCPACPSAWLPCSCVASLICITQWHLSTDILLGFGGEGRSGSIGNDLVFIRWKRPPSCNSPKRW